MKKVPEIPELGLIWRKVNVTSTVDISSRVSQPDVVSRVRHYETWNARHILIKNGVFAAASRTWGTSNTFPRKQNWNS